MVYSIAPNAKILLVIANSNLNADLYQAVQCAKANADVVSDSWGGGEFSGETSFDPDFSSQVPILFSSGDTFAEVQYPCASPNVTCVGGTHLLETSTSYRNLESVWDEVTGGGCSSLKAKHRFRAASAPVAPNGAHRMSLPSRTHIPERLSTWGAVLGVWVFSCSVGLALRVL